MGAMSPFHLLFVLIVLFGTAWPISVILRKAGFSGWWALLSFVPLVNLAMLWVFAFAKWPIEGRVQSSTFE